MRGWGPEGLGARETIIAPALDAGQPAAVSRELDTEFCTDRSGPRPATGVVSSTYCKAQSDSSAGLGRRMSSPWMDARRMLSDSPQGSLLRVLGKARGRRDWGWGGEVL